MSSRSAAESAGSTSASNAPGIASSASAKPTSGGGESSPITGPESPAVQMFLAYMPYRTLMPDGTVESGFAERLVVDALHGATGNKEPLILAFARNQREELRELGDLSGAISGEGTHQTTYLSISSAAASPAKTSLSPDDEPDLKAEADPASSSSAPGSLTLFSPLGDGSCLRTYPDSFPASAAAISPSYSRRWPTSGFTTSPGECWTADTSESPSAGGVSSSLRDVLGEVVPPRYFLSQRAAAGILRRAEKRGRQLPGHLTAALEAVAGHRTPNA